MTSMSKNPSLATAAQRPVAMPANGAFGSLAHALVLGNEDQRQCPWTIKATPLRQEVRTG